MKKRRIQCGVAYWAQPVEEIKILTNRINIQADVRVPAEHFELKQENTKRFA